MTPHYLVKGGCSKFLDNTGIVIWCQSEEVILSRQLSCTEATARYAQVVRIRCFYVSTGRHFGASAGDTVSFLEQERYARSASSSRRLCPFTGHISSTYTDNFEPICNNSANKPYSVYCVLTQSSDTLMQIIHFNSYVTIENIWVSRGKAVT